MATFLFDKIIFGPVNSRRLGVSLGINLLPVDRKVCSFDCLYCECGYNQRTAIHSQLPTAEIVAQKLEQTLKSMDVKPDVITFAGNGEPTLHPDFQTIIDSTVDLRNRFAPNARIAVLSNATQLHRKDVCEALRRVDQNILKIDAGDIDMIRLLNRPQINYSLEKTAEQIAQFGDNLIVQTMFVRWQNYDNSTDDYVSKWMKIIEQIRPPKVMIYTIARDTPLKDMQKVPLERLNQIAEIVHKVVKNVEVSG